MAGGTTHDRTMIGVGPALAKAREHRGLSIEQAARDTRLRADQIAALEDELFDVLPGGVYVRASLRTYAGYLGLNPDKVIAAYARHAEAPEPPPPPGKLGRVERMIAATRIRDNQRLLLIAAAGLVAVLIVFGWLSRDHAAPPAAAIPTQTVSPVVVAQTFDAAIMAQRAVEATVTIDGVAKTYTMSEGEQLSFEAEDELTIDVADGGVVSVVVAGRDFGIPAQAGQPWTRTFTFEQIQAWPSPSPSPSASASGSPS
jgi:hypothetical protein